MLKKLAALLLIFTSSLSFGQNSPPYGYNLVAADGNGVLTWGRYLVPPSPAPGTPGIMMHSGVETLLQPMAKVGAGLSWDGTSLYVSGASISSITGLQAALDAKFATPSGTSAQCVRGDGTVGTCPSSTARTFSYPTRALSTCFQPSTSGQPTTVAVTVGQQVKGTASLAGVIPAGAWVQIEPANTSGTNTFSARQGQEVQL